MGIWVSQSPVPFTGLPASLPSPCAGPISEWHRGFKLIHWDVMFCGSLSRLPFLGREALFAAVGAGIHGWAPAAVGAPCG